MGRLGQSRQLDTARLGYMQKLSRGRLSAENPPPKMLIGYSGSAKTYKRSIICHGRLDSPRYIWTMRNGAGTLTIPTSTNLGAPI
jgi:hypothetical protein